MYHKLLLDATFCQEANVYSQEAQSSPGKMKHHVNVKSSTFHVKGHKLEGERWCPNSPEENALKLFAGCFPLDLPGEPSEQANKVFKTALSYTPAKVQSILFRGLYSRKS